MFKWIAGAMLSFSIGLFPLCGYSQEAGSAELLQLNLESRKTDSWHGFRRHKFLFEGCEAWVVEPKEPRGDRAFTWCMMFPDAFTERCAVPAMLERGFYHVFLDVGNSFGSPEAVKTLHRFHQKLQELGLAQKTVLIGISRGGLYAHRYATEYPDRVALIYGDAPVLDFKSWPAGFGNGKGSAGDWELCKKLYGLTSDEAAKQFKGNPIDTLDVLATAKIPVVYVVGDKDDVVPYSENTAIVEERYPKLGGTIKVFHKPDVGHHPHGLDDPDPLVKFIETHLKSNP
jgi:pimeloyl-ACP methyl ester carboxylesterase